jgi:hypothetical protein
MEKFILMCAFMASPLALDIDLKHATVAGTLWQCVPIASFSSAAIIWTGEWASGIGSPDSAATVSVSSTRLAKRIGLRRPASGWSDGARTRDVSRNSKLEGHN